MGYSNCLGGVCGDVADTVLLPGDPLRAKYIAEKYLTDVKCYNEIRGMYGYTGYYNGKRVSVQSTGMGVPSICLYLYDLIHDHKAKNFIRIGTAGTLSKNVNLRDVVVASTACSNNNMSAIEFPLMTFAPTANYELMRKAVDEAKNKKISFKVGSVLTSDLFYEYKNDFPKKWTDLGILAAEMETAGLYTYAAKFGVRALSLLTISDNILTGEQAPIDERRLAFDNMIELALEIAE
ncbi:MAG: purine-nucleoside phosphorylase [Oscillospiraceae bacterium]